MTYNYSIDIKYTGDEDIKYDVTTDDYCFRVKMYEWWLIIIIIITIYLNVLIYVMIYIDVYMIIDDNPVLLMINDIEI